MSTSTIETKLNEILQQELGDEYLSLTAHFLYHIDEKAKMIVRLAEEKERKRLADLNKFNIYAEDKHKYELKPQYLPSVIVKNIMSFVPLRDHVAELKSIFGFDTLPDTHVDWGRTDLYDHPPDNKRIREMGDFKSTRSKEEYDTLCNILKKRCFCWLGSRYYSDIPFGGFFRQFAKRLARTNFNPDSIGPSSLFYNYWFRCPHLRGVGYRVCDRKYVSSINYSTGDGYISKDELMDIFKANNYYIVKSWSKKKMIRKLMCY